MWFNTNEIVAHLGFSRSKLYDMKKRGVLLKGRHWTRKDPSLPKSDLLWHVQRIEMALGRV